MRKNLKDRLKGEVPSNRIFINVLEYYEVEWLDWNSVWEATYVEVREFFLRKDGVEWVIEILTRIFRVF